MKKNGWFRFYERMIDSPQVLELNDTEFRLLVSLWCLASTANDAGRVPFTTVLIRRRVVPNRPLAAVQAMLDHLVALDLLRGTPEGYTVARWTEHQYAYKSWEPDVRAAQKRKERATPSQPLPPDPPPPSQDNNGRVASVSQVCRNTDTDVETDKDLDLDGERREDVARPAPVGAEAPPSPPARAQPKHKTAPSVPGWGYPAFWVAREEAFSYPLPKGQYGPETQAVNEILADYPDVTPDDLTAFLVYRRTCFGVDPASAILLHRHKAHFGPWWAAGCPATQVQNGGNHAPEAKQESRYESSSQRTSRETRESIASIYAPPPEYSNGYREEPLALPGPADRAGLISFDRRGLERSIERGAG